MITVAQVEAVIERIQNADPAMHGRIAFLVTFDELNKIMDEIESGSTFMVLDAKEAKLIRAGRVMLHINGTPVLPELMATGPQTFDG